MPYYYYPPVPFLCFKISAFQEVFLTVLGKVYKSQCCLFCNIHHSPVNSYVVSPHTLLGLLLSNICDLCSSLRIRDHVFHNPIKVTVLYILIFTILESRHDNNMLWTKLQWKLQKILVCSTPHRKVAACVCYWAELSYFATDSQSVPWHWDPLGLMTRY
jgi:hypothetical protein